jgi:membrane-associated HD superfamily phosphohydrolase
MLRQMYTAVVVALIAAVAALGTSLITAYRQKKIAESQETSSKAIAESQQAAAEKLERLRDQLEAQRELVYTYDRELKARRVDAYMSLYKRTATSRRYWRTNPKRIELSDFSQAFDEWYFSEQAASSFRTRQDKPIFRC